MEKSKVLKITPMQMNFMKELVAMYKGDWVLSAKVWSNIQDKNRRIGTLTGLEKAGLIQMKETNGWASALSSSPHRLLKPSKEYLEGSLKYRSWSPGGKD